jgi:hypothetical protein
MLTPPTPAVVTAWPSDLGPFGTVCSYSMRNEEVFRWWVTSRAGQREYLTRYLLDEVTARKTYLTARPELSTRQVRQVPVTDEEKLAARFKHPSAGRTP